MEDVIDFCHELQMIIIKYEIVKKYNNYTNQKISISIK